MKALVIYDSQFGHTEQIAKAIGEGLGEDAKVVRSAEIDVGSLADYDIIVIGAPTQAGRPMKPSQAFLDSIPAGALRDKKVAAYDTRARGFVAKLFGWAADRIATELVKKGGNLVMPPEGFYVKGTRGPLVDGELKRATDWAKSLASK